MTTTNAEIKVIVEQLSEQMKSFIEKFDDLNKAVISHHALDAEKCAKIDMLFQDVHGDGNGKKGIRRELDRVLEFIDTAKRFMWIVIGATATTVIGAIITIILTIER